MTPDQFRRLALSFPDASEHPHMGHPTFRYGERYSQGGGMVKLTPEQQRKLVGAG
jgi:hypothetical protein